MTTRNRQSSKKFLTKSISNNTNYRTTYAHRAKNSLLQMTMQKYFLPLSIQVAQQVITQKYVWQFWYRHSRVFLVSTVLRCLWPSYIAGAQNNLSSYASEMVGVVLSYPPLIPCPRHGLGSTCWLPTSLPHRWRPHHWLCPTSARGRWVFPRQQEKEEYHMWAHIWFSIWMILGGLFLGNIILLETTTKYS